jgi:hypothetical protein
MSSNTSSSSTRRTLVPVSRLAGSGYDRTLICSFARGHLHNGEVFDAEIVKLNVEQSAHLRHQFHRVGI